MRLRKLRFRRTFAYKETKSLGDSRFGRLLPFADAGASKLDVPLAKKVGQLIRIISRDAAYAPIEQARPVIRVVHRPGQDANAGGVQLLNLFLIEKLKIGTVDLRARCGSQSSRFHR